MTGAETDGEPDPSETRARLCSRRDLGIYGRSRPIDFSTPCFYAQHLTSDELTRFCELEGVRPADFGLVVENG
jgi:hypothetical protein